MQSALNAQPPETLSARNWDNMSTPKLGRNARLFKDGTVIGYAKDISVKASADLIKEYSMDSLTPAIVAPGKQTFTWSAEKLYIDGAFMTLLLNGTEFDIVFAPTVRRLRCLTRRGRIA